MAHFYIDDILDLNGGDDTKTWYYKTINIPLGWVYHGLLNGYPTHVKAHWWVIINPQTGFENIIGNR